MKDFSGKIMLVTASSGIGLAMAKDLQLEEQIILLLLRSEDKLMLS